MRSAIWICYDLGVRGDYGSLYTWLDDHEAKECGDNLAFLNYEHAGALALQLTAELRGLLQITKQTRIYLIYKDDQTKKIKGSFIIGGRKAAAWSGYSGQPTQPDVEDS